ncbi:phosphoglycerate mutase-like protein [Gymnopilus junonius]|uniref:Phosphoglycerate mutase-like protein n=1 Tax=Gymnopilus junonius TaxID=109634 RepID=A0A9P5NYI9_GYMJU|nr:phosphoglycerate mutase-like protein [Gymnopilus junonius]
MVLRSCLVLLPLLSLAVVKGSPAHASSFAGSTSTFLFPPAGVTVTATDTFFLDESQIGFAGPTPTGDEAFSIQTATAIAKLDNVFPLVQPNAQDSAKSKKPFNVLTHLGNLSPWQSVDSSSFGLPNTSPVIPSGCELRQVHLAHRHGARYPTSDGVTSGFAAKLQTAVAGAGFSASGALSFLNTWTYKLGAEILTPFGRSQIFELGVGFRVKYGDLLKGLTDLPVFRTTSEERMIDSALHFAAGFFGVQSYQQDYHQLIMVETDGQNNTLAPYENCANADNAVSAFGSQQANKWANIYLKPTLKRLSPLLHGVNLTINDLVAMQELCAYETVSLGFSQFCDVFTEEEWEGFEYFIDLQFWYGNGPGNPTTAAMGIGYVEELVSRLTQTRITTFDSAVNATIVTNPVLFPVNQSIYVDASHDTVLSTFYVAMNFSSLAGNGPLPTDHIPKDQTYFVNQLAPFGSNLVGQVLSCPASSSKPTHIRWILNDGVLPLTGIKGCKSNSNGLCDLDAFIAGMKQRIEEVDFNLGCFGNITVPVPDNIVDGQLPASKRKN